MGSRLSKLLVLAMIAVALVLGVLFGVASGVADRIFGGPKPETIAEASGCSLPFSRLAATRRSSFSSTSGSATTCASFGFPSVSVPVLSTTRVSIFSRTSNASAFLINTPIPAPRPVPTMIDIGVAKPSAQGQAMMSTAIALKSPWAILGSGPNALQATGSFSFRRWMLRRP